MANHPTFTDIQVAGSFGSAVAITVTIYRLAIRTRCRALWWDDALAMISAIAAVIFLVGIFVSTANPPDTQTGAAKAVGYYMVNNGFYSVIWASRASVLFSFLLIASGRLLGLLLKSGIAAAFLVWIVLFAEVLSTCLVQPKAGGSNVAGCSLDERVAVTQIITEGLFDFLLFGSLLQILQAQQGPGLKIRMLILVFLALATTAVNSTHASAILHGQEAKQRLLAGVGILCLFLMNLTVFITWKGLETTVNDSNLPDSPRPIDIQFTSSEESLSISIKSIRDYFFPQASSVPFTTLARRRLKSLRLSTKALRRVPLAQVPPTHGSPLTRQFARNSAGSLPAPVTTPMYRRSVTA